VISSYHIWQFNKIPRWVPGANSGRWNKLFHLSTNVFPNPQCDARWRNHLEYLRHLVRMVS